MGKMVLVALILGLMSCNHRHRSHEEAFKTFMEGISTSNMSMVEDVCTEPTYAMIEYILDHDAALSFSDNQSGILHIVSAKDELQQNIAVTENVVLDDGNRVQVKFKIGTAVEEFVINLVNIDDDWFVDIPVIDSDK